MAIKLCLLTFTLLLITSPLPSFSLSFSQYQALFSVAHSLTIRVANLRAARGDLAGAARARLIAQKLQRGLGLSFWRVMLSTGWDYLRNYSWTDTTSSFELFGAMSDINELIGALNELNRMNSGGERAAWVQRNYSNVLRVSKSLFGRLIKVFNQSGPLREMVETAQREVVDGELLRDYLELGSNDLKSLLQIFKEIALQYSSAPDNNEFQHRQIAASKDNLQPYMQLH